MRTPSPSQLIAEPHTILRCEVGSGVHGLAVNDQDDRDEMGICFEPPEYVIGLEHFEQWVFRTKPQGERSGPGDLDLTIYSARKWCSLALKGNPTVLLPLFVPPMNIIVETVEGYQLRDLAWAFASKRAGNAFLGYMQQQRQRLTGERGQKNVKRPELVDAYGYDCYLDDTEFLTGRGWLTYDEIRIGDCLATASNDGQLRWEPWLDRVEREYSGPIHFVERTYQHAAVTPNHRMLAAPIRSRGSTLHRHLDPFEFYPMSRIAEAGDWMMRSALTNPLETHLPDVLLALVGGYVAEGCVGKRLRDGTPSVLRISQRPDGRLVPFMRDIFREIMGSHWYDTTRDEVVLTIADRNLASSVVADCGEGSASKRLPAWFSSLGCEQARYLLSALVAGDGTDHRSGGWVYYTQSRQLAGDVQALALVAGYTATQWGPYAGMYHVRIIDREPVVEVRPRRSTGVEHVDSRIVCFTVPSETLVTRRNGHTAIQGNTKYAGHILRLGYQGIEYMNTGRLTLPMPKEQREFIVGVRKGEIDENEVLTRAGELELELKEAIEMSPLPDDPAYNAVNRWLIERYPIWWKDRVGSVREGE